MRDNQVQARALILSFKETDIPDLDKENASFQEALEGIGIEVQTLDFELQTYKRTLRTFLNGTKAGPRMIYISCHGGETGDGQLQLSGKYGGKVIKWPMLLDVIGAAECDVLIILNCCNTGLAGATALEDCHAHNYYSKELIAASDWGNTTEDNLTRELCESLPLWCHEKSDRQANSLYRVLMKTMKRMRDDALMDQAERECTDSINREEASLKRSKKRLWAVGDKMEEEAEKHGGARRKGQASDKQWEKLEKEAEKLDVLILETKQSLKRLRSSVQYWEKSRDRIRTSHPQPYYTKLNPKGHPWTLKGGHCYVGKGSD